MKNSIKKSMFALIAAIGIGSFIACAQTEKADKMKRPQQFTEYAFEGILLEPAQQTRIDSLNSVVKTRMEERKMNGTCAKKDKADRPCKKDKACKKGKAQNCAQCPDSAICKAGTDSITCQAGKCGKKGGKMKKGACKGEGKMCDKTANCKKAGVPRCYVEKVEEILTPDQFAIFVQNVSNMPEDVKFFRPAKPADCNGQCPKAKKVCKKAAQTTTE